MAMEEIAQGKLTFDVQRLARRSRTAVRGASARGHNMPVARILVGVTGGIAAYKACELVRLLVRAGHDVTPLVTRGARAVRRRRDVLGARAQGAAGRPVPAPRATPTCSSSRRSPRTRMARLAHGLADDLLTETALAHRGPVAASRRR